MIGAYSTKDERILLSKLSNPEHSLCVKEMFNNPSETILPKLTPHKEKLTAYPLAYQRPLNDEFFPAYHHKPGYTHYDSNPFLKKSFHVASMLHNNRLSNPPQLTESHRFGGGGLKRASDHGPIGARDRQELIDNVEKSVTDSHYASQMKKKYHTLMYGQRDEIRRQMDENAAYDEWRMIHHTVPVKTLRGKEKFGRMHPMTYATFRPSIQGINADRKMDITGLIKPNSPVKTYKERHADCYGRYSSSDASTTYSPTYLGSTHNSRSPHFCASGSANCKY